MARKRESKFVNKEIAEMYGRLAKIAANNATLCARGRNYEGANTDAAQAEEWARRAGGNVIRGVSLQ